MAETRCPRRSFDSHPTIAAHTLSISHSLSHSFHSHAKPNERGPAINPTSGKVCRPGTIHAMALDRDPINVPARTRVHDGSHGSNVLIQVEVAVHLDIDVGEGRIDGCIDSTIPDLFQYRSERRMNKGTN